MPYNLEAKKAIDEEQKHFLLRASAVQFAIDWNFSGLYSSLIHSALGLLGQLIILGLVERSL
jgi:hypothetical protein